MEFERMRFIWDAQGLVEMLVDNWIPESLTSEKAHESSLYEYLHAEFEHIQITRQYARGRATVDLVVGDKVMIELKYNLLTTSELQRLKGQLTEYKLWNMGIVIVLTGQTDINLLKDLRGFVEREINSSYVLGSDVAVFTK